MDDPPTPDRSSSPHVVVSNRQDLTVDEPALAALAERVLAGEGAPDGELSLSFVSSEEMAQLHVTYSGEPGPTDVLAFPMGEDGLLGDVVICPAEAGRSRATSSTRSRSKPCSRAVSEPGARGSPNLLPAADRKREIVAGV